MIDVNNQVHIREVNGEAPLGNPSQLFTVSSHWNRDALVVLEFRLDGVAVKISVLAADLIAALRNATNVNR